MVKNGSVTLGTSKNFNVEKLNKLLHDKVLYKIYGMRLDMLKKVTRLYLGEKRR